MSATPWPPPHPDHLNQAAGATDDGEVKGNPLGLVVVGLILLSIGIFYSWGAFIFVMALIVCIFFHELGHYLAAKRAGMKVTQFFLFFGPRLWSFRRGETEFGVRLIPAGAFVKVPGMHNLDAEVEPGDEPRTFRQAPFRGRFLMAAAGSCMHFAIALVLLFVSLVFVGRPKTPYDWAVSSVATNSAAEAAGLQPGDRITAIDGVQFDRYDKVVDYIIAHPQKTVALEIARGDQTVSKTATIGVSTDPCRPGGLLGIRSQVGDTRVTPVNPVKAVQTSFVEFGTTIGQSVQGLGKIFSPSGLKTYGKALQTGCNTDQRLVSPIGAAKFGADFCGDVGDCLVLLSAVNIFIGLVNWFPMLPFDGGHMVIALYEKIRSRRGRRYYANIAPLLPITYALFALMLVLFIGNTYLDLRS